ncbi:adenosine receptor A3-like [Xenia sp. Carnegie-2017]|uniref:adenosine receptor A3-like n=1 Tax=Xenia sp. Carnegie-2017 TaxID=2897299 RepID=UPI001F04DBBB|nr:adenosine receptor A3-like [Xenia sp. Carnegie-2017]
MNHLNAEQSQAFSIFEVTGQSLCVIIGVTGNIFVILYNVRWNTDKNTSSYFLISLAVSDLVVCWISLPLYIVMVTQLLIGVTKLSVPCKLIYSLWYATISTSVVNLMMLTIDRYICIALPLKYPHIVTQRKVSIALASAWITGFLSFIMIFFNTKSSNIPFICYPSKIVVSICTILFFLLPLGVMIVFNVKIVQISQNQGRKIAAQASSIETSESTATDDLNSRKNFTRQLKLFKTIRIVFGYFLLCITPLPVIVFIKFVICNGGCISLYVLRVAILVAATNSVTNAFIYGIRDKDYRRSFKLLFARCCNSSG